MKRFKTMCQIALLLLMIVACNGKVDSNETSAKNEPQESFKKATITTSDDVDIHFTTYGDQKNVVLFVHGWSCDQTYWKEQIDFFKERYQVITVDLAGHGKSTTGMRDQWTIPALANDIIEVLKTINYSQVTLVGHSLGSMVAIEAACKLDKERTKVVTVDYLKRPFQPLPEETVEGFLTSFRTDFEKSTNAFTAKFFRPDADSLVKDWIMKDMASGQQPVAIALMKDLATRDFSSSFTCLEDQELPRYIINSDFSPIDESHYSEMGFEMHLIPETGHFLMLEKPQQFNELVDKLIRS